MNNRRNASRLIFNKSLNSNIKNIRNTCMEAQCILIENSVTAQDASDITIAIEEALSNIILHGHKGPGFPGLEIDLKIEANHLSIDVDVIDNGHRFDIHNVRKPDIKSNLTGDRHGGFGVFLIKKLMDSVEIFQHNNRNILKMKKMIFSSK